MFSVEYLYAFCQFFGGPNTQNQQEYKNQKPLTQFINIFLELASQFIYKCLELASQFINKFLELASQKIYKFP